MKKEKNWSSKNQLPFISTSGMNDAYQYSRQKRKLPYVVCAHFNPAVRRREYFTRIQYFMLDIDHITDKNISLSFLRQKFQNDPRILLGFVSPGEDGLKLLFRLSAYCYDYVQFSLFYRQFAQAFSQQYQLDQVLDTKTSDATRACFISHDEDAWYCLQAEDVSFSDYINLDDTLSVAQQMREMRLEQTDQKRERGMKETEINQDIFAEIRQKLNPRAVIREEKNIFVPQELDEILELVEKKLATFEIQLSHIRNIHYGKKLSLVFKTRRAEINVFYGKNGFRIVESPKNGTDPELNSLAAKVLHEALGEREYPTI